MSWYRLENADTVRTPALVIHPDRIRENIRRMIEIIKAPARLRPHVKTHKLPQVVAMQRHAGIEKFKCATIAEAEMIARAGATDVLLAYQPVGPNVERLRRLASAFSQVAFSTLVDNPETLASLGEAFRDTPRELGVFLEIDNGMHRTGMAPDDRAIELYRRLAHTRGLRPSGLHVYDGHIRDADLAVRIQHVETDFRDVLALRDRLAAAGLTVSSLVAGGTPTFPAHARHADRECSPGTCLLWDKGYASAFADLDFQHAAVLLTRVISKPGLNRICVDLGYKAVAADPAPPRVHLLDIPDAQFPVHSEEHLVVETAAAGKLSVGDVLYAIPTHVCPTCALHREVTVAENGRAVARWAVAARDRDLDF